MTLKRTIAILTALASGSCQQGNNASSAAFSSGPTFTTSSEAYALLTSKTPEAEAARLEAKARFAAVMKMSIPDFYTYTKSNATDATFHIDHVKFSGLRSQLEQQAAMFDEAGTHFSSVREQWIAAGFDPEDQPTLADLRTSIVLMGQLLDTTSARLTDDSFQLSGKRGSGTGSGGGGKAADSGSGSSGICHESSKIFHYCKDTLAFGWQGPGCTVNGVKCTPPPKDDAGTGSNGDASSGNTDSSAGDKTSSSSSSSSSSSTPTTGTTGNIFQ